MSNLPPGVPARSLLGQHTFSCALTTRGGICDCLPDQADATPPLLSQTSTARQRFDSTASPTVLQPE